MNGMMDVPEKAAGFHRDGRCVELAGVLIRPGGSGNRPVVIWIHGFGASFSFPRARGTRRRADRRQRARAPISGPWCSRRAARRTGAAAFRERIEDSPRDLAAWVDFGAHAGFATVLLGHSLGAVKVTYSLVERPDPRVAGLALASPPLRPSWDTRAHPRALAQAQRLMAEERPEALFAGPWGTVSAQTYMGFDRVGFDQFGRDTRAPNLARVRCPIFVASGRRRAGMHARRPGCDPSKRRRCIARGGPRDRRRGPRLHGSRA